MKSKFDWYLNPSNEELEKAWTTGTLTVDTNVLLDLYRYHEDTRDSLINSLQKFEGKKWLSHQASIEFFRNRKKVIISSEKAFKQAQEETEKLSGTLNTTVAQLKGNRIIPSVLAVELENTVRPLVQQAQAKIAEAKEKYPKFLHEDPILNRLLALFDGAVGEDFPEEEKKQIQEQAEKRKIDKVPPGYMDEGKDGERPFGDYYFWLQVIQHAKEVSQPIILVTSERKEDWWEIISGKTTGPRPELLKEAKEASGQRILIYQTERFLEHALKRFQQPVNETAIEEIKAVSNWRSELDVAVKLHDHSSFEATPYKNSGKLSVELLRPVRNFTVSGHLEPNMHHVPQLSIRLLGAPESLPPHRLNAGTGTNHDFNIHIVSNQPNNWLPVGLYLFGYEAVCPAPSDDAPTETAREI
jgi:hypothetical protein